MSYCLNPHCQKPQNPDATKFCLTCGSQLRLKDRYRALRPIGEGAFGRTFLAVDEDRLKTRCVIKQFWPHFHEKAELEKATALFKQEAQRLHELGEHPQIPTLLASLEQDQRLYLVEELIEGQNLLQELQQQGAFFEQKVLDLLIDLLPVLQFVHEHQVIHRDIKPENILRRISPPNLTYKGTTNISPSVHPFVNGSQGGTVVGNVVLVDFGVAKQISGITEAKTGTRTGTAGYAPIEQIRGGKAYPASDLYSLGVTCIHLLTCVPLDDLFDALEGEWIWRSHLTKKGRTISQNLGQILDKLLKDSVKDRYQSAAEVLQDLTNGRHNAQFTNTIAAARTSPPPTIAGKMPAPQFQGTPDIITAELAAVRAELNQGVKAPTSSSNLSPPNSNNTDIYAELESVKSELSISKKTARTYVQISKNWQCIHILKGHSASVNAVAISPNSGGLLASGSDDKTIKIWNLKTGQLIHSFFGHSAQVDAVAISPDGRILISGGLDKKIIQWKLDTREMIREFYSHFGSPQSHRYGAVHSLAFSFDGGLIASGSADKSIKLWNQRHGELIHKFSGHLDKVLSVSFSPNPPNNPYKGRIFASGSADETIKIWGLGTWENIRTLMGHLGGVYAVAFSPNSSYQGGLLVSGGVDATIKLWNVDTGELLNTFIGHSDDVLSVAISPDGSTIASGSRDGTVKLWNLQTGELLSSFLGQNPVAFSADGQTLASGGDGGQILIWRMSG